MSKNWKFLLQVALSLVTFGGIWAVNNSAAIITAISIIVAYLINVLLKLQKIKLGRGWLTVIVYVISLAMAYLLAPGALPPFGIVPNDPALFVNAFLAYLPVLALALSPYSGAAMAIYNTLLKDVLDQVSVTLLSD